MPALLNSTSSRPNRVLDRSEQRLDRSGIGDVGRHHQALALDGCAFRRDLVELVLAAAGERDCIAGLHQGERRGAADAGAGAGDDGDLLGAVHGVLPTLRRCLVLQCILVRHARNAGMGGPQRRRPALAQIGEIRLAGLDAVGQLRRADVAPHHQHVDRHADAQIGAHGRIDRDQADLERVIEVHVVDDGAVEHRLAVFVLADLQIGRVGGAFDEVAGGIDHVEPRPLALDLAAEQERHVELDVGGFERAVLLLVHRRIARPMRWAAWNMVGAFISVSRSPVAGFSRPSRRILRHRLGERQVAGRRDRHDALAGLGEGVQLAEHRDVVEARIGAGVGDHHQSLVDEYATAIGHGVRLLPGRRRFGI